MPLKMFWLHTKVNTIDIISGWQQGCDDYLGLHQYKDDRKKITTEQVNEWAKCYCPCQKEEVYKMCVFLFGNTDWRQVLSYY